MWEGAACAALGRAAVLVGERRLGGEEVVDQRLGGVHLAAARLGGIVEHLGDRRVLGDEGGEDGREHALEVEEAPGEGGSGHLHAALVGAVDLEVVAVGGVEPEHAVHLRGDGGGGGEGG